MSLILSIETSTKVCSVAIHANGALLSSAEVLVEKSHSKIITGLTDDILKAAGFNFSDLNAVAVSKGPGSYTGLRIGVSTAKGLCYGLSIPLIGVNTLEAMALEVNRYNGSLAYACPMIDARRMEVFCAVFDKDNNFIDPTHAKIIEENSFEEILKERKILFFGDGSSKTKSLLDKSENAVFIEGVYPSAKNIGFIAHKVFEKNEFENLIYFEPFYLKDFISTSK